MSLLAVTIAFSLSIKASLDTVAIAEHVRDDAVAMAYCELQRGRALLSYITCE